MAPCQAVLDTEMKNSSCGRNKAKGKQAEARPELPQAYLGRPREPSPAGCPHVNTWEDREMRAVLCWACRGLVLKTIP